MIRDRIALGRDASEREREAAAAVATRWRATVGCCLGEVDAILVPTTPMPAPLIDDEHMVAVSRRINRLNAPWSLAGLPAVAIPAPIGGAGLPVGVQLVGPSLADRQLLDLAQGLQQRTDWHTRRPPVAAA
jgi:aspartyl-tRNA(Asn)/glutamyl-tRNA(Gln) amidotransferase subunit A